MAASVIDLQLWSAILPSKVPDPNPKGDVTMLLAAWSSGDKTALDKMIPLVYAELHHIARRAWSQSQGNTLQPTALINEAYLKLANAADASFQDRCHFFAVASGRRRATGRRY